MGILLRPGLVYSSTSLRVVAIQPAALVSIMYFVCVHFTKLVGSKMLISILISPSPPSGLLCSCFTMLRLYQSLDNIWRSRILVHPTLPICIQTTQHSDMLQSGRYYVLLHVFQEMSKF